MMGNSLSLFPRRKSNKLKCKIRNGVTGIEGGAYRLHEISQSKCTRQASLILWIYLQGSRIIRLISLFIISSRRCSLHQVAFGLKQRLCTGCLVLSWHLSHDSRARRAAWALPCSLVSRELLKPAAVTSESASHNHKWVVGEAHVT